MVTEKYSLEQRLCLYDSYVKSGSAKKTQKLFREKYPSEIIPSKSAIHKLVNHVRMKGTLLDLKKKPRQVLTDDRSDTVGSKSNISDSVGSKSKKSKSMELSAAKLLELQLQAVREKEKWLEGAIFVLYMVVIIPDSKVYQTFYRFPRNKEICKQWVIRSGRADLDDIFKTEGPGRLNKSYVVCSDHFVQKDFRNKNLLSQGLWPGSLPSVLPSAKEIDPRRSQEKRKNEEELKSETSVFGEVEVVLADADTDEEEISIKDDEEEISIKAEPSWTKESEDSPSGDSENSYQEIATNVKREPVEEPTFVSVKQEPEEYLEGEEVDLRKKIKREDVEES